MTNEEQLEEQIAKALSSYFEAGQQIARTALERALSGKPNVSSSRSMAKAPRDRARQRKRSRAVIDQLCESFCAAVSAHAGESMKFLAERVGERPTALSVVVSRLKRADRIRTVGSRQFTRYFPATETAREAAA